LLKEAGWRFFDDAKGKANIVLEAKSEDKHPLVGKEHPQYCRLILLSNWNTHYFWDTQRYLRATQCMK
jgi:type I restriction enzyme R subunit